MGVHKTVKSSYLALGRVLSNNTVLDWKWFLEQEANTWSEWVDLPSRQRLQLYRRGFTSPCEKLYDFDSYGFEPYLSELQRNKLYRACNGNHRYLLDDKLSQHWMLSEYETHRPRAFGLVDRGRIHSTAETEFEGDSRPISQWLPRKLREESRLVLKHLRGKGGKEVIVVGYDESDGFSVDGTPVSKSALLASVEPLSNYLVTEFIDQHPYADELYPHASNTIRLLTVWDDVAEELFTPAGVQRIGTDRSRPLDNFSVGGLSAALDIESGTVGHAAQYPFGGSVSWYNTHPDTGEDIYGKQVPNWDHVRSVVEAIARDNTNIPIIGWDVLLDRRGEPVVLEANTGTGLDLIQVHEPLLANEDVARVAARYLPDVSRGALGTPR